MNEVFRAHKFYFSNILLKVRIDNYNLCFCWTDSSKGDNVNMMHKRNFLLLNKRNNYTKRLNNNDSKITVFKKKSWPNFKCMLEPNLIVF